MPEPPAFVVKKGTNTWSRLAAATPQPLSAISMDTNPRPLRHATSMRAGRDVTDGIRSVAQQVDDRLLQQLWIGITVVSSGSTEARHVDAFLENVGASSLSISERSRAIRTLWGRGGGSSAMAR